MRRKQQTLVIEDGMELAQPAPGLTPTLPGHRQQNAVPSVGKSWDLTVEAPDPKTDPVARGRGAKDGRSWWPFGGGREAVSTAPVEVKEEVTAISSFTFD
eukprot:Skav200849  [mRNA]  locus=scaffold2131:249049:256004:- [translate_table: standard]